MKHAWGFFAVNRTMGLACLLLGCTVDNPGMSDPAKPVYSWDGGVTRFGPTASGNGGAGTSAPFGPGTFDPAAVYMNLSQTADKWKRIYIYDLTDISRNDISRFTLGLLTDTVTIIRPTDGALIYRQYVQAQNSTVSGSDDFILMRQMVPDKDTTLPELNDIDITLPKCTRSGDKQLWFSIAPDTGDILTQCADTYTYLTSGVVLYQPDLIIFGIGNGGKHLATDRTSPIYVLSMDGTRVNIGKTPGEGFIAAVRATPTGFWVVYKKNKTAEMYRLHILYDGTISETLLFPPTPVPVPGSYMFSYYVLDAFGRAVIIEIVSDMETIVMANSRTYVIRLDPNGAGEVLLDLSKHPELTDQYLGEFLYYNPFITGP